MTKTQKTSYTRALPSRQPFQAGDHNAAKNRHDSMTKTTQNTSNKKDRQKMYRLGTAVVRKLLAGFNMFDGTNPGDKNSTGPLVIIKTKSREDE